MWGYNTNERAGMLILRWSKKIKISAKRLRPNPTSGKFPIFLTFKLKLLHFDFRHANQLTAFPLFIRILYFLGNHKNKP